MAERREELLRAAIEQIEARGVAAVRIADVASVLGVSNALVLYHFSTKEKLVSAAFTYAAEDDLAHLRKLLGRRTSALRRLRAAVRWYAPTGQAKGWRLWIEGWAAALREPALQEVTRDLDKQWKGGARCAVSGGVWGGGGVSGGVWGGGGVGARGCPAGGGLLWVWGGGAARGPAAVFVVVCV
ncbi:TetR/AcrR family transcriptional regulator [Streptomyces mirabilis]